MIFIYRRAKLELYCCAGCTSNCAGCTKQCRACGSGADCKSIQPNGMCFQPNTLPVHASYAVNSYWQNNKIGGGTCDFGGTAMLITVDPSKYLPIFRNVIRVYYYKFFYTVD